MWTIRKSFILYVIQSLRLVGVEQGMIAVTFGAFCYQPDPGLGSGIRCCEQLFSLLRVLPDGA